VEDPVTGSGVHPEKILQDLAGLWTSLGGQEPGKESQGVLRACAMTFIVAAEDDAANETIALLMREHPSRAIALKVVDSPAPKLDARVFAQCWMPFGKGQQICCEQVEITASPSRLEDAASAVLGLTVPDLPAVLWLRQPSFALLPEFRCVLRLSRTVILDSAPAIALDLHRSGWRVRDLAWTRLTCWREAAAAVLAGSGMTGGLESATISCSGPSGEAQALYFETWLCQRLPRVRFHRNPAAPPPGLRSVSLRAGSWNVSIDSEAVVFPGTNDYALLREELSILGRDPVFEQVLAGLSLRPGGEV
jgi:glucose-6-phosphate dehydrogenase assembly protein OpcA